MGEWVNGRMGEWVNERTSEWVNGYMGEWANQPISEPANQRLSESANQRIGEPAEEKRRNNIDKDVQARADRAPVLMRGAYGEGIWRGHMARLYGKAYGVGTTSHGKMGGDK